MKIIYLVRDGRGNSCSLMRRKDMDMERAAKLWVRYNWNLNIMMKSIPRKKIFFLRYEDLCRKSNDKLNELSKFIGVKTPLKILPIIKESFHNIGGNPMRFNREETGIRLDEKWKFQLNREQIDIFERIGGRLNRKLGYKL